MKRLILPLLCVAVLATGLTGPATPAQEAEAAKAELLSGAELAMWHAWITADFARCYGAAQTIVEDPATEGAAFGVALALQAQCAEALNWQPAFLRDLRALAASRDGPERDLATFELATQLTRAGQLEAATTEHARLNFVDRWWVAGSFPNDRGQGFEDAQEPESGLDLDAEYPGKEGQTVRWRALPARAFAGAIDLGAMLRPATEATAFLMTALWCEAATETTLSVASTDQVKAWHLGRNAAAESPLGEPVIEMDAERDLGLDQNQARLHLRKGWNVVVIKAGVSEGEWKLRVRLPNARVARDETELRAALAANEPFEGTPEAETRKEWTLVDAALELLRPKLDRSSTLPRTVMQRVRAAYKGSNQQELAVLSYLAAWTNRSSAGVAAGREENRRRELLLDCLTQEPGAARAAHELAQYYTGTFANPALADEYAALAVKLRPDWIDARMFAAQVPAMKGLSHEIERELASLLKQHPDHPSVQRMAAYYAGRRDDYTASNRLFEAALKGNFTDTYARDRLLERAVSRGDGKAAQLYASQVRQLNPFDTGASLLLCDMHVAARDYAAAEAAMAHALNIAPRDDTLLARMGGVLTMQAMAEAGEAQQALRARGMEFYRQALEANPRREDLLRYLEFQDRERPKFEALLQEDITARLRKTAMLPTRGDDPWEIVYRDQITVINEDGTKSFYTQEARRVLNDTGRDALQTMRAPAWGGQQSRCVESRVFRTDGRIEEGRRSMYGATFANLEVGDVVHVRFRVTDREQTFFGDFFGTREVLADYVPVRLVRHVFVLPPGREFYDYTSGGAPARVETTVEGRRVWTYTAQDIPKLADETLAPPPQQRAATVQISTYRNWGDFGRWYYNLIRKQLEPTPEMTAKVAELTAAATSERERVRAIYNWIVTEVRYNADWHFGVHGYKPFSAGAVFARCIGDCKDKAILMCAMLELAGVKAYPVIINLEYYRGAEDITLPMPGHFNHAIAYVEYSDGKGQFLDGTTTYNGMDELPGGDAGASVIVVRPEGGVVMRVPVPAASEVTWHDEVKAEFVAGGLKLQVMRTATGDSASSLRAQYQREGDRKRLLEQEWAETFAGATVSDISAADLSDLDSPPWLKYSVELPGAAALKDGEYSFRLALNPSDWGRTAFASLSTRRSDLLLPPPSTTSSTWEFTLPPGFAPAALPEPFTVKDPHATGEVSAAMQGGKLVIRRSFAIQGGVVKLADYPAWRRALLDYDKAESFTIRLKQGEQR